MDKYKFWFYTESPSEKEKSDYINLKNDMTFSSVSEGDFDTGKWRLYSSKKRIYLSKKNEKRELIFIINQLRN